MFSPYLENTHYNNDIITYWKLFNWQISLSKAYPNVLEFQTGSVTVSVARIKVAKSIN